MMGRNQTWLQEQADLTRLDMQHHRIVGDIPRPAVITLSRRADLDMSVRRASGLRPSPATFTHPARIRSGCWEIHVPGLGYVRTTDLLHKHNAAGRMIEWPLGRPEDLLGEPRMKEAA